MVYYIYHFAFSLSNQYVKDTAELYVEQINKIILRMNTELIQILTTNDNISRIPQEIYSTDAKYYELLNENGNNILELEAVSD